MPPSTHTHGPGQTCTASSCGLSSVTIPLALGSPFIPALLRERWSIPVMLPSPLTSLTKGNQTYIMGVPLAAWTHNPLLPVSLQAEVQTQIIRRVSKGRSFSMATYQVHSTARSVPYLLCLVKPPYEMHIYPLFQIHHMEG